MDKEYDILVVDDALENLKVLFEISDTGIGIKKDEIDRIFDNFFQASNNRNGTGLGLSITKKLWQV